MVTSGNTPVSKAAAVKQMLFITICLFCAALAGGCEEDIPPPPEMPSSRPAPPPPELDALHMMQFRADRSVTFTNMVLVLQADAMNEGFALSLTSTRSADDGSTVIFGERIRLAGLEKLVGTEVSLRGSRHYTGAGSMVRTPLAVYKPREAVLRITSMSEGAASGTVRGAFYRYAVLHGAIGNPTEIDVDAFFTARLIVR